MLLTLCRFDFLFLSRKVSGEGNGIRFYRFLIIAVPSTLSPPPSNLLLTFLRLWFSCGLFWLSMFFHFLIVYFISFILFRIAWWPSAGKELSSWISAVAVLISCSLKGMCSFPIWCLGQDVEFDCIGSWSLPFHLLWFCVSLPILRWINYLLINT